MSLHKKKSHKSTLSAFTFTEKIFKYPGMSAWFFVLVSKDVSQKLKSLQISGKISKRGWGSIPVRATVGQTTWQTSVFPDKKSGCYLLPIKREVRLKEDVWDGDSISVLLRII
jgi:hypothetical protein